MLPSFVQMAKSTGMDDLPLAIKQYMTLILADVYAGNARSVFYLCRLTSREFYDACAGLENQFYERCREIKQDTTKPTFRLWLFHYLIVTYPEQVPLQNDMDSMLLKAVANVDVDRFRRALQHGCMMNKEVFDGFISRHLVQTSIHDDKYALMLKLGLDNFLTQRERDDVVTMAKEKQGEEEEERGAYSYSQHNIPPSTSDESEEEDVDETMWYNIDGDHLYWKLRSVHESTTLELPLHTGVVHCATFGMGATLVVLLPYYPTLQLDLMIREREELGPTDLVDRENYLRLCEANRVLWSSSSPSSLQAPFKSAKLRSDKILTIVLRENCIFGRIKQKPQLVGAANALIANGASLPDTMGRETNVQIKFLWLKAVVPELVINIKDTHFNAIAKSYVG